MQKPFDRDRVHIVAKDRFKSAAVVDLVPAFWPD